MTLQCVVLTGSLTHAVRLRRQFHGCCEAGTRAPSGFRISLPSLVQSAPTVSETAAQGGIPWGLLWQLHLALEADRPACRAVSCAAAAYVAVSLPGLGEDVDLTPVIRQTTYLPRRHCDGLSW